MSFEINNSREHARPQELIDLEWKISKRYTEIKGVPQEQFAEWLNVHGVAVSKIVDNDQKFAEEFVSVEDPDIKKIEKLLKQQL